MDVVHNLQGLGVTKPKHSQHIFVISHSDFFRKETVQNNAISYNNINSMRDRCTVHVVLHKIYMIQQKNIKNVFTQNNHMTSNMLKLLASL